MDLEVHGVKLIHITESMIKRVLETGMSRDTTDKNGRYVQKEVISTECSPN